MLDRRTVTLALLLLVIGAFTALAATMGTPADTRVREFGSEVPGFDPSGRPVATTPSGGPVATTPSDVTVPLGVFQPERPVDTTPFVQPSAAVDPNVPTTTPPRIFETVSTTTSTTSTTSTTTTTAPLGPPQSDIACEGFRKWIGLLRLALIGQVTPPQFSSALDQLALELGASLVPLTDSSPMVEFLSEWADRFAAVSLAEFGPTVNAFLSESDRVSAPVFRYLEQACPGIALLKG